MPEPSSAPPEASVPPAPSDIAQQPAPAPAPISPPSFNAHYLHNPPPQYPALSRRLGESGRVVLRVLVTPLGTAERVELRTSSGSRRLVSAALDTALINQLELNWKVASGAVKHTVLGGLELAREKLDRQNYTFGGVFKDTTQPLLGPDPATILNYTKTPAATPLAESDTIALYVQDQIEPSKQWKAVLGARWERVDTESDTDSRDAAGRLSRKDSLWSGRAGLIWQPNESQSYYVSWGNAYNPSGSLGAYSATGSELAANNDTTDPENTVSYEVGSQWDFTRDIRVRAALFRNEKTDERVADPAGGMDLILAGRRRMEGVEFELAGRITNNWDIYGAVAFMNSEILDGPNRGNSTNVPDHAGSLWTLYRLGGGWEVGGGAFWSSSALATINGTPAVELPSWTRWDATIAYVRRKYEVRLNFNNLTDEKYYIAACQNGGNRVVPAVPRSTLLSVRYNFD